MNEEDPTPPVPTTYTVQNITDPAFLELYGQVVTANTTASEALKQTAEARKLWEQNVSALREASLKIANEPDLAHSELKFWRDVFVAKSAYATVPACVDHANKALVEYRKAKLTVPKT